MDGHQNFASPSSLPEPEDVKPLRSLAPMFPATPGFHTFSPPNASPFVCVTPFGSFAAASGSEHPPGFCPLFPSYAAPRPSNQKPMDPPSRNADDGSLVFPTNAAQHPSNQRPMAPPFMSADDGVAHRGESSAANGSLSGNSPPPSVHTPSPIVEPGNEEELQLFSGATATSGRMAKRPLHESSLQMGSSASEGSGGKKAKKRRPKGVYDKDLLLLPCPSHDPRESVEVVLMTFDALRRRLMQLDEVKNVKQRPDLKAGTVMISHDLRANMSKGIGHVPGVEVGDIFYFRIEMCLVGLHTQSVAGIDYLTAKFGNEHDPVAVSIVSAGVYENEEGDVDALIYSGQGHSSKDDQKLERGNLALERSLHRANEIRVIRSVKDLNYINGKIYIYDGLYKINESWVEKAKSGFNVFKYKLLREPGQPDGIALWKRTAKWKENPLSRGKVILPDISSGTENVPVCLVNDVDDEKGPGHFTYSTKVNYLGRLNSVKPLQSCMCTSICLPGDSSCSCTQRNGGDHPYNSNGLLVRRKPLIYECSASCQCSVNCRNRVTQKGIQLHFEVFKTRDRGWGLRCWDPIRAGTFICEYTGDVIDDIKQDEDDEEDDYIFQMTHENQTINWNYGPELLGEPSCVDSNESSKLLPIIISAKKTGNISRFMNHSCSPNAFWQPVQHDHGDERYPHIMFFALKHIPPMTEVTYDYGPGGGGIGEEEMVSGTSSHRRKKCLCGSLKCRGLFV